jgi:hypothetical protein
MITTQVRSDMRRMVADSDRGGAIEVGVGATSLQVLQVTDFEVVDFGSVILYGDCTRNP